MKYCKSCDKKHYAKGLCEAHYKQMKRKRKRLDKQIADGYDFPGCYFCGVDMSEPGTCIDCTRSELLKNGRYNEFWRTLD